MNKEKQLEEMTRDIPSRILAYNCDPKGQHLYIEQRRDIAKKLVAKGYRKQSENVIELPCKVGDTMYVDYKGIAYPVKVNAIRIDTKKNNHRICVSGTFHLYEYYDHNYKATFPFDSIGKSLFYTEAEAKMKGGAE